jgi:hypothetical protein
MYKQFFCRGMEGKAADLQSDDSFPPSAEVNDMWSIISTFPYALMGELYLISSPTLPTKRSS